MTQFYDVRVFEPWDISKWWGNAEIRREKQRKRTDKTAKTLQKVLDERLSCKNTYLKCSQLLNCSVYEARILIEHYFGSQSTPLTESYIDYFIYDMMDDNEVKVQEWINKQRKDFKHAPHFEKLFDNPIENHTIARELKLSEQEYVKLLVEYLGNPPFLVEDYESIDWDLI